MKIKFEIDVKGKKITFFIKRGELQEWVKNAIDRFPELKIESLSKKGSEFLALTMTKVMEEICGKEGIEDWNSFKPDFVMYKDKIELPLQLRG